MRREDVPLANWCGYKVRQIRPPFEVGPTVVIHKAVDGTAWDYLAWLYYNDEEKWYVIADVNGVDDPFVFPGGGEGVVIPKLF